MNGVVHDDRGKPVFGRAVRQSSVTRPGVERGEVRVGLAVVQQVDPAIVNRRRRRGAEVEVDGLRRPVLLPQELAVECVAEHTDVLAERHVEPFAVGERSLRGVCILPVPAAGRFALVRLLLPLDLAGGRIERVDHVPDLVGLFRRLVVARAHATHHFFARQALALELGDVLVAVESGCRLLERLAADAGGEEHRVAPDDRRRPSLPGHRYFPAHVLGRRPLRGHRTAWRNPTHAMTAESGPRFFRLGVRGRDRRCDEQRDEQNKCSAFHAFENTSDCVADEADGDNGFDTKARSATETHEEAGAVQWHQRSVPSPASGRRVVSRTPRYRSTAERPPGPCFDTVVFSTRPARSAARPTAACGLKQASFVRLRSAPCLRVESVTSVSSVSEATRPPPGFPPGTSPRGRRPCARRRRRRCGTPRAWSA